MTNLRSLTLALLASLAAPTTACGPAQVEVAATVPSRLVLIAPGVWVVEDHPYAVYYVDGWYWTYRDGMWLRSYYADGAFAPVAFRIVPPMIVQIEVGRPHRYVRYRAPRGAEVRRIERRQRTERPRVRDNRR